MLIAILVACLYCKYKKLKIKPIFKAYPLYPIFVLEIIHLFFQGCVFAGNLSYVKYATLIKTIYMYSLILPIIAYKLYKPAICGSGLVLLGTILNRFVMYQNGNKMPVYPTLSIYTGYFKADYIDVIGSIHIRGDSLTKYKILTDYIDTGFSILSVGDVLIKLFVCIIFYYTIKELNNDKLKLCK